MMVVLSQQSRCVGKKDTFLVLPHYAYAPGEEKKKPAYPNPQTDTRDTRTGERGYGSCLGKVRRSSKPQSQQVPRAVSLRCGTPTPPPPPAPTCSYPRNRLLLDAGRWTLAMFVAPLSLYLCDTEVSHIISRSTYPRPVCFADTCL